MISCNDSQAEVGSTLQTSVTLTCLENATFAPFLTESEHKCEVPPVCPDENLPSPDPESGLVYKNATGQPTVAYRSATFVCNDSTLITDLGKEIQTLCLKEGTFEEDVFSNLTAITCREPVVCPEYIPFPTMESGLKDSASKVQYEGEIATYECFNSPTFLVNGADLSFNLTCQKWGFSKPVAWPSCIDPSQTTTTTLPPPTKAPCQCIGDEGIDNEKLLDAFCRLPQAPGNVFHYNGYTPASRKRCGNRSPDKPTLDNHCFCDTVDEQAPISYLMTIALNTKPWQWLQNYKAPNNASYLQDSKTSQYLDLKMRIEKAVRGHCT